VGFQDGEGVIDPCGVPEHDGGHAFRRRSGIKGILHLPPEIRDLDGQGTSAAAFAQHQGYGLTGRVRTPGSIAR